MKKHNFQPLKIQRDFLLSPADVIIGAKAAHIGKSFQPLVAPMRKFWSKKLSHIKKPTIRKRLIIDRIIVQTLNFQKKQGLPTK